MIVWVFLVAAAVGVFVVAAVAVGRESFRLGHQLPASIFDIDEAVDHVSDGIPAVSQARLNFEEVRALVTAHVDYLEDQGLVGTSGRDPQVLTGESGSPVDGAGEDVRRAEAPEVVVVDGDALAFVLGRVDEAGLDVIDEDAYAVMTALHRYLVEIGAVGPQAGDEP